MVNSRANPGGWSVSDELTSGQQNNVDIGQARSIDKTNETSASGGGVSGEVDFLSGSSQVMQSGSTLTAASGSVVSLSGSTTINSTLSLPGITNVGGSMSFTTSSALQITSGAQIGLVGTVNYNATNIGASGSSYTCDTSGYPDYLIFVNTSTTAKAITLPNPATPANSGRIIVIKDSTGNAGTHSIGVSAAGGSNIDNSATFHQNVNWEVTTYACTGTVWRIIADTEF